MDVNLGHPQRTTTPLFQILVIYIHPPLHHPNSLIMEAALENTRGPDDHPPHLQFLLREKTHNRVEPRPVDLLHQITTTLSKIGDSHHRLHHWSRTLQYTDHQRKLTHRQPQTKQKSSTWLHQIFQHRIRLMVANFRSLHVNALGASPSSLTSRCAQGVRERIPDLVNLEIQI